VATARITSKAFEWDRETLYPASVRVHLGTSALAEMEARRETLASLDLGNVEGVLPAFPVLAHEVELIRRERIELAPGFCIIDGSGLRVLDEPQRRGLYLLTARLLGSLLQQNAAGDQVVEVFDRGRPLAEGGRYHQTNASGVVHSDSPQWPDVPDYVALLCVRAALRGGESKFISGYSVLKRLQELSPNVVHELYGGFLFDKRGDFAAGEAPVTAAPVFRWAGDELHFRYLRAYIDSGQALLGLPLSAAQMQALDALDVVLAADELVVKAWMAPGDMQVLNNHFVVHDRTPFEDHPQPERRRLMLRTWLRRP
jgi:alpha-ketoglutarate-dependent taurine dioxygenase